MFSSIAVLLEHTQICLDVFFLDREVQLAVLTLIASDGTTHTSPLLSFVPLADPITAAPDSFETTQATHAGKYLLTRPHDVSLDFSIE
jgi:hypothetical protein